VVIGVADPNPQVAGGGAALLAEAGLSVTTGVLAPAASELIAPFRKLTSTGLPWVTLKLAASLDGRIATATGNSRWITGPESRRAGHRLRNTHDAVLVGVGTVVADDPGLTCRIRGGRNPTRVVLDGRLRTPLTAQLVGDAGRVARTMVITGETTSQRRQQAFTAAGVEIIPLPRQRGRIAFETVLRELGQRGIMSVLVEGGARVASEAVRARMVDALRIFYAPLFIGGDGRPMLDSLAVREVADALRLGHPRVRRLASDILVATEIGESA
jgi:diaminohydroxyphosphoribosylaminopyrimidine deaminase/5-amino-6-(5-phosphoribosylamino)uracil reductase